MSKQQVLLVAQELWGASISARKLQAASASLCACEGDAVQAIISQLLHDDFERIGHY